MKKITLGVLMFFMSFCCFAQFEGFDGTWTTQTGTGAGGPAGWAIANVAGPAFTWGQANGTSVPAYAGGHAAYLVAENVTNGTTTQDWLISPIMSVPANGQLRFQSRLWNLGDQGNIYKIMVSPITTANTVAEQTTLANFGTTPLVQWTELQINPSQLEYTEKVVSLAAYANTNVYIAFVMEGDNGDRWLVDNFKVVPECAPPSTGIASNIGSTTADLSWANPSGATVFEVEVLPAAASPTGAGVPTTSGGPNYAATNLTAATAYKYYVRALCGTGNLATWSAWVGPFNFTTSVCPANQQCNYTFTLTDSFGDGWNGNTMTVSQNGVTMGTLGSTFTTGAGPITVTIPLCTGQPFQLFWNSGGSFPGEVGVSITNSFAQVLYTKTPGSGVPNSVLFTGQADCVNPACLPVTGLTATAIGTNTANLGWAGPATGNWQYYVVPTGTAAPAFATMGTVTTINPTTVTATTAPTVTNFTPATTYQFYVRVICTGGTYSTWAGPFSFTTLPTCAPPTGLALGTFGATSATFNWAAPAAPAAQPGSYDYYWSNTITPPTGATTPTGNVTPTTVTMGSLTPSTTYYIWVRSHCSATDSSTWVGPVSFTTPQVPTNLPIAENWDSGTLNGWTTANGTQTNKWFVGTATFNSPGHSLYVSNDNGVTNAYTNTANSVVHAYRDINVPTGTTDVNFGFDWKNVGETGWDFIRVWVVPASYTPPTGTMITASPDRVQIGGNFVGSNTWTTFSSIQNWTAYASGIRRVVFEWRNDGIIGSNPPGAVDNINISVITCPQPTALTATSISNTTATLGWTSPGPAAQWEYYLSPLPATPPTASTTGVLTSTTTATVTVTPSTQYQYWVRSVCGPADKSLWSGPYSFNTPACPLADQCNYTFVLTDSASDGWNGNTMTVSQNGVPVTSTLGSTFTSGAGPVTVQVALCPDLPFTLFWNAGGNWSGEVGVTILTPFAEDIYVKPPGTGSPNTLLYTGTGDCTPPPCPKPQNLAIDDIELDSAEFSWTEMGSAIQWEVIYVPAGSPAPVNGAPVVTANIVNAMPFIIPGLNEGTGYDVYIRALCGGTDGNSNWSGPVNFTTAISNDDCSGAIVAPVNPNAICAETVTGTINGATSSGVDPGCYWATPEEDVWYSFTATNDTHSIALDQQAGAYFAYALYTGNNCGALDEFYCTTGNSDIVNGLTVGTTYYVLVYSTYTYDDTTSFELCITTPEPPITVSETQYTIPELITDVFLGSDCAYVDNFAWVSGFNSPPLSTWETQSTMNGIGYWESNGSSFQFSDPDGTIYQSGIVLVSGDAETDVPGPNDTGIYANWSHVPTKTLLESVLNTYLEFPAGNQANTQGHTSIKFDFSPLVDLPQGATLFKFLFASEEYGTPSFECTYSDVFAFILTDLETNEMYNLAVLPNGQLILVTNIHPEGDSTLGGCDAVNEQYFGQYNGPLAPINFNGQTVKMDAILPVDLIAGHEYSMQMIVANEGDNGVSSAVFLLEGSFDLGEIDLGSDLIVSDGTALCAQEEIILSTNLDPDDHTFTWFLDGEIIPDETGDTLVVTEGGVYSVEAAVNGIDCIRTGSIVVEFYDPVADITGDPEDLSACHTSGFASFDLTVNTAAILAGATSTDYTIEYYLTEADATDGTVTPLTTPFTNTVAEHQTIWVRIENDATGCFAVKSFDLNVQIFTAQFTITDDFSICEGTSGVIEVVPGNFDAADVTFSWTKDTTAFAGTTGSITVTEAGVYEVSIDFDGCIATASVTVVVTPIPVAQELDDETACDSYTLGALTAGNSYFTEANGAGTQLFEGDLITNTQEIFILAQSGTTPNCTSGSSFTVTIVQSPVIVDAEVVEVAACDSYTLPVLTVGAYFDAAGVEIPAGTEILVTTPITVNAVSGDCSDTATFTVTITTTPVVADLANVAVCDIYYLETLPAGNTYYTGPGATGQVLAAGASIIDNQTIYIHAVAAGNADCTAESSFDVVIIPTPEILITEICNDLNQYELGVDFLDELYNEDVVTYSWTNAAGAVVGTSPTLILSGENGQPALGEGVYHVTVTPFGDANCPDEGEIDVISTACSMPKGISPNGDGLNDNFDLSTLDVRKLVVFNRYGKEVYKFTGAYTNEFGGVASNGENLPSGTYFYMVERTNGETLTGWVYINWEK